MNDQRSQAHSSAAAGLSRSPVDGRPGIAEAEHETTSARPVRIILGTEPGERVMRPDFGAGLRGLVFEPINTTTMALVQYRVQNALVLWEPRIDSVTVSRQRRPAARQVAGGHQLPHPHDQHVLQPRLSVLRAGGPSLMAAARSSTGAGARRSSPTCWPACPATCPSGARIDARRPPTRRCRSWHATWRCRRRPRTECRTAPGSPFLDARQQPAAGAGRRHAAGVPVDANAPLDVTLTAAARSRQSCRLRRRRCSAQPPPRPTRRCSPPTRRSR